MQTFTEPKSKPRIYKGLIITISCLLLLSALIYFNLNKAYLAYYYVFEMPHLNTNDKLYVERSNVGYNLMKLIRPMTDTEIDEMYISDEEKADLKLKRDPSMEPYLYHVMDNVTAKSTKDAVAIYQSHEILNVMTDKHELVLINVFAVKPIKAALEIPDFTFDRYKLPEGYTYASNVYYGHPSLFANE
ncbi:hypothetical protein [Mucilaginibacter lacusdianchii]|uniref:hypothetical protein n=1 Tax=Mucilaginibacter lacusdianchii TaxID=2684211 RepID=UPI00131A7F72|nr:hypothetical protein [Mucilaginibacter sp. JXJ CY 39]